MKNTKAIRSLSFDEAAELAYFGAKILHPSSIQPAKKANIPVRMKNTMNPSDEGTLITKESPIKDFKAVAAKDGMHGHKSQIQQHVALLTVLFGKYSKYSNPGKPRSI